MSSKGYVNKSFERDHRFEGDTSSSKTNNFISPFHNKECDLTKDVLDMERKIRVLIAKPGLDGHDRGAKVVARALRDSGMEVIYTGLHQTPEQIVEGAIQEDVDVIGLSLLSGAHMVLFSRVLELLEKNDAEDIVVMGGGIIPESDAEELKDRGMTKIFGPGTTTEEIVQSVKDSVKDIGEE